MQGKEQKVIGIGLVIGVVILIILAVSGFFSSKNDKEVTTNNTQMDSSIEPTMTDFSFDYLEESAPAAESTEQSTAETIKETEKDGVDNAYIEWQQVNQFEQEIRKLNTDFLTAYYGNLNPVERNAAIKKMVTEKLFSEEELPESGQVIQPHISSLEVETYTGTINQVQGKILNVVSMKVDNVPQKMLMNVTFVRSDSWLIDQLSFEIIQLTN